MIMTREGRVFTQGSSSELISDFICIYASLRTIEKPPLLDIALEEIQQMEQDGTIEDIIQETHDMSSKGD